jgi:ATP-dependent Lon protease
MSGIIVSKPKTQLPLLLTDGFFVFPKCNTSLPLTGENEKLKPVLIQALKEYNGQILVVSSKEKISDLGSIQNLDKFYLIGTWGKITLNLTSETDIELIKSLKEIRLQGLERVRIIDPIRSNGFWESKFQMLLEPEKNWDKKTLNQLTKKFIFHLPNILEKIDPLFIEKFPYLAMGSLGNFIDLLVQNSPEISRQNKQEILASIDLAQRLDALLGFSVSNNQEPVYKDINNRVNSETKKEEKIYHLRKMQKEIQKKLEELEGSSEWWEKYLQRLEKEPFPQYVAKVVNEQINHYKKIVSPYSSEASIIQNYVDFLMSLPWYQISPEVRDLDLARQELGKGHFGLKKIKKRITDYIALNIQTEQTLGQVICLVGPPGVGKTSLAKSMAKAIGRKFVRVPVGGNDDGAELKGHRRTYLGAMSGKIIQGMKQAGILNPLFLIDEVDKMVRNFRGDPTSILLEVFDKEQNKKFIDNYLGQEVPYDLSKVMFVCTANSLSMPSPLLDRMEIIRLSDYTEMEKVQIAKKHLIPKISKTCRLKDEQVNFSKHSIKTIIRHYTYEAGVRKLNEKIWEIVRSFVRRFIEKKATKLVVTPKKIASSHYLGKFIYDFTRKEEDVPPGIVNGLAWTERGGDILPIEANFVSGKGELGELTGSLGNVIKESAKVAFNYTKSYLETNTSTFAKELKILQKCKVNIHAPEGAVPKDGPSAGIALTTAIISALSGKKIPTDIGMTGEITLSGQVLPIGGLRNKSIAAQRAGLKTIFIPQKNEKDIEDIPSEVRKGLKIILVSKYSEILEKLFPLKSNFTFQKKDYSEKVETTI